MGYKEIKPNLFMKEIGYVTLYHDFRKGFRWSYAYKGSEKIEVHKLKEYHKVKALERVKNDKKV